MNTRASQSRQERKQQTRDELLGAALSLLESNSFSALSLREVARAAGVVPTAFYRHFESMDELGLVLVDESFRTLRQMLRSARADTLRSEQVIRGSVETLVRSVHESRAHFRFIARERFSGNAVLRHAIRGEIRLVSTELATDLARFPFLKDWGTEDLQALAALFVNAMVLIVEDLLEVPAEGGAAEQDVIRTAEKQLAMIVVGVPNWR
ncbi:MAG: hypothetical protein QOG62_495 [Thermoleophilaceae bacterium]|nr:hypothetical protein [Thermoleophilaceae bacterium]